MAKVYNGGIQLGDSFNIRVSAPIDDRMVVSNFQDLIDSFFGSDSDGNSVQQLAYYEGMEVYVASEHEKYVLTATATDLDDISMDEDRDKLRTFFKKSVDLSSYSTSTEIANTYATKADVPTKTSELTNDSEFITKNDVFTKTSELTNDSGFITSDDVPTKTSDLTNDSGFITSDDVPTKTSELTNDSGFLTEHQSLEGYATESWVEGKGYLTEIPDTYALKTDIPTKTSELENDSNFLVGFGSLSDDSNDAVYGAVEATELDAVLDEIEDEIPTKTSELENDSNFVVANPNEISVYSNVESAWRTITYNVVVAEITINETTDGGTYPNGYYAGFSDNQKVTGKIFDMTFLGKENAGSGAMISINVPSDYTANIMYNTDTSEDSSNPSWSSYTCTTSTNEGRTSYIRSGQTITGPLALKVIVYKNN